MRARERQRTGREHQRGNEKKERWRIVSENEEGEKKIETEMSGIMKEIEKKELWERDETEKRK